MNDTTDGSDDQALADEWAAALAEDPAASEGADEAGQEGDAGSTANSATETASVPPAAQSEGNDYTSATFQNVQSDGVAVTDENSNLNMVLDIPVTISMELGRTKINIRNLLQLNQGSVVELDRLAGEPMDVLVNGTLVAHGEVVVVNEKLGIRLTDVISAAERVKKLR
ncbi:MAG: flagellar motor switch protein FliN [Gammaproteobacteria bacterium]|nr:flagellar motor switch protein FliN [Gammaproteobacteria bacterium]